MVCGVWGTWSTMRISIRVASQKGTFVQDLGAGDSGTGRESGEEARWACR